MGRRSLLLLTMLLVLVTAPPSGATVAGAPHGRDDCATHAQAARPAPGKLSERNTAAVVASSEIPAGAVPQIDPAFEATVPVWFHVIAASTRPRDGWVSDRQIADQIEVLNRAYRAGYGGADTGFRFTLAGVTRTVNPTWFEMATFADELAAKSALRRGDATTLNLYSTSGAGFLGWAYYPSIVAQPQYEVLDGAVVHFDSLPGGKLRGYNLGHTATHEVGHWLGLAHTFEQGCQGHGDHVADTPPQATPSSGCPIGKDTCTAPGLDPIHNYMDYSTDTCYREFTPGQGERAQEQYLHWRVKVGS